MAGACLCLNVLFMPFFNVTIILHVTIAAELITFY